MSARDLVSTLGGIFEHSPWVAEAIAPDGPFADVEALHEAMKAAVRSAPEDRRIALLAAHPELAGKMARAGEMTASSVSEQSRAGLDRLSEVEFATLDRLNVEYRERFGFPFIIAVRDHDKESILEAFEARLDNSRDTEVESALNEVSKITRYRLEALIS